MASQKSKRFLKTIILPLGMPWVSKKAVWSTNYGFGLLFSSQNWINSENIPKSSNFLMDFDDFCRFFECYSILAEKQRTKQTNCSFLNFFVCFDTYDTFKGVNNNGVRSILVKNPTVCWSLLNLFAFEDQNMIFNSWSVRSTSH